MCSEKDALIFDAAKTINRVLMETAGLLNENRERSPSPTYKLSKQLSSGSKNPTKNALESLVDWPYDFEPLAKSFKRPRSSQKTVYTILKTGENHGKHNSSRMILVKTRWIRENSNPKSKDVQPVGGSNNSSAVEQIINSMEKLNVDMIEHNQSSNTSKEPTRLGQGHKCKSKCSPSPNSTDKSFESAKKTSFIKESLKENNKENTYKTPGKLISSSRLNSPNKSATNTPRYSPIRLEVNKKETITETPRKSTWNSWRSRKTSKKSSTSSKTRKCTRKGCTACSPEANFHAFSKPCSYRNCRFNMHTVGDGSTSPIAKRRKTCVGEIDKNTTEKVYKNVFERLYADSISRRFLSA